MSMAYRRRVAEKLRPQLEDLIEASKNLKKDDEDDHIDILPSDQHNLATWLLVSAVWGALPTSCEYLQITKLDIFPLLGNLEHDTDSEK